MDAIPFEDFLAGISRLGGIVELDDQTRAWIEEAARTLEAMPRVTVKSLASLIGEHPDWVPILGLSVGLTQEQLRNTLRYRFGSPGWEGLAKTKAAELVSLLDDEFRLVQRLKDQRVRRWSFADVLAERYASRLRAAGSIGRGRRVEDQVERIVDDLELPRQMRTQFRGRGGQTAPCDLAIPEGGQRAQIVCGIKGFDSTGSKLTDAAREIEAMAEVRLPNQYVFAVVDGIGWLSRQADLRRIHSLWDKRSIDGLYTLSGLADFRADLEAAARRLELLSG
ncbi:MAG: hypothetical protein M3Q23_07765 [Actinomycetota bacterium]|nr:hypothetical protein [Actinomycetota bacterium]